MEQFILEKFDTVDPFEYIYECIGGTHGPELYEFVMEMYSQIVIDYGYHPDDDFEPIIEKIIEQIEGY